MRRIQSLNLVGGYKLKEGFARGSFAVDWARMTLKMTGNLTGQTVLTYDLANAPPMQSFPVVHPVDEDWGWWEVHKPDGQTVQYANGLWWDGERWWAAPRAHYDMSPSPDITLYASDGTVWTLPLPQQHFSGFVKTPPDANGISWPYMGCGGYESGQGTPAGPTMGDYLGNVYLDYDWLDGPGASLEHWNTRAPRLPDYFPEGHVDSWIGWEPRQVADTLQGRWASDWLFGGGVILPDGPLVYFPYQGTGELKYDWHGNPDGFDQRTVTFAEWEWLNRTTLMAYDPDTFACLEFDRVMDFRGPVGGQEIDPQGRLWLAERYAHGPDHSECQIRVYEVAYDGA